MWDNIYLRISELSCTLEGLGNSNREVREINVLVLWCRELGLGTCRQRARSGEFVEL